MKKVKVGVFGAARGMTMINVLKDHPDAELVAVCDKFEPLLEKCREAVAGAGGSTVMYSSFEEFFAHDMGAVVLANYADEHAPFAIRLLDSGRHVLSEVLPVATMAEAVALTEAVERSGLVYAFAENYCYMNHTFEMRRRYENGDIGEVTHAEGEYVHDCTSIWPRITYGERGHWRNRMYSTFYCTHSIGPIITMTGRRPVRVTGYETPNRFNSKQYGRLAGTSGMILLQLDNGATVKSLHGGLKREPGSINYVLYGREGVMETDRMENGRLNVYIEGEKSCEGEWEKYSPKSFVSPDMAARFTGHGGSDFYPTHFFLEKILGRPDGARYGIDVYTALDMALPGILAYRSILNGNAALDVPDFRDAAAREPFREDHASTTEKAPGGEVWPCNSTDVPEHGDEVFAHVKSLWEKGLPG